MENDINLYREKTLSPLKNDNDDADNSGQIFEADLAFENRIVEANTLLSSDYFSEPSLHPSPNKEHYSDNPKDNKEIKDTIIYFIAQSQKLPIPKLLVSTHCPLITPLLSNKKSEIAFECSSSITPECIKDFFSFCVNSPSFSTLSDTQLYHLFLLSTYFKNDALLSLLLSSESVHRLTPVNAARYLNFIEKYKSKANKQLYTKAVSAIIKNLSTSSNIHALIASNERLSPSVAKEVIELHLHRENLSEVNEEIFAFAINSLGDKEINEGGAMKVIFEMFEEKFTSNFSSRFKMRSFPTIIDISGNEENKGKGKGNEIEVVLDEGVEVIVQFERDGEGDERSIGVSFKAKRGNLFIYSVIYLNSKDIDKDTFTIVNFSQLSQYTISLKSKDKLKDKLYLHLKIDYIFTVLFTYLTSKITLFYTDITQFATSLSKTKISFEFFKLIIRSLRQQRANANIIFEVIMIYYDNLPIKSEWSKCINELLESVNFREVKTEMLSEFYMKYNMNEEINRNYINLILNALKAKKMDKVVMHCAKQLKAFYEKMKGRKEFSIEKGDAFEIAGEQGKCVMMGSRSNLSNDDFFFCKGKSYLTTSVNTVGNNKVGGSAKGVKKMNYIEKGKGKGRKKNV